MSRLSRVIAPMLRAAGLDVRTIGRADGEPHELVITNPRQPNWGRVTIDRDGLMEWDYRGDAATDAGAASIATVIIAVMAPGHGHQSGHDPRISHPQRGRDHH